MNLNRNHKFGDMNNASISIQQPQTTLVDELAHLKKSLKKKRNSQIWQQMVQFYRNHQPMLNHYHILKIVKIAIKPIKSSILRQCASLFSKQNRTKQKNNTISQNTKKDNWSRARDRERERERERDRDRDRDRDDSKNKTNPRNGNNRINSGQSTNNPEGQLSNKMKQSIENLENKMKIVENLLDCYTVALQQFLLLADPSYFKMIFKNRYTKKSRKPLIFQASPSPNPSFPSPSSPFFPEQSACQSQKTPSPQPQTSHSPQYPAHMIQHQIYSYIKFVCDVVILLCTCAICYHNQNHILACFAIADRVLADIFQSSFKFANKKLQYWIVKYNYLAKFQGNVYSRSGENQFNQVSKFGYNWKINFCYQFPLEPIHQLYKNSKKWSQSRIKNTYLLIMKYLLLTIRNVGNPHLRLTPPNIPTQAQLPQPSPQPPQQQQQPQLQNQIYILMKQLLLLNQYIRIPILNININRSKPLHSLNISTKKMSNSLLLFNNNNHSFTGRNQLNKKFLEFMSAVVEVYENQVMERRKWRQFLGKFFNIGELDHIANVNANINRTSKDQRIQGKDGAKSGMATRRQQQTKSLRQKRYLSLKQSKISKISNINSNVQLPSQSTIYLNKNKQNTNKKQLFQEFFKQIAMHAPMPMPMPASASTPGLGLGPQPQPQKIQKQRYFYGCIEQSSSDQEGFLVHQFQAKRRKQLLDYQNVSKIIAYNNTGNQSNIVLNQIQKPNKIKQYSNMEQVNNKLQQLEKKTQRFRSFSASALQNLTRRKDKNNSEQKIQQTDKILAQIPKLQACLVPQQKKIKRSQSSHNGNGRTYPAIKIEKPFKYLPQIFSQNAKTQNKPSSPFFPTDSKTQLPLLGHPCYSPNDNNQLNFPNNNNNSNNININININKNNRSSYTKPQIQHLSLSDKYDKMSKMILLSNTGKFKNFGN